MKTAALVCGVFALLSAVGTSSIDAELACETARMVVKLRATPDATPKSDKCSNCNGTGKIGDGKVFVLAIEEAVRIRTDERGDAAV